MIPKKCFAKFYGKCYFHVFQSKPTMTLLVEKKIVRTPTLLFS